MQWHYLSTRHLRFGRKLAWVSSGAPVEILRAMDVVVAYPENYAALCGAQGDATDLCQIAEGQGYSADVCSYARTHIGSVLDATHAPLRGLPEPDLLICCNNICGTVIKWFEALSLHYRVPLFVLDTPFLHDGMTAAVRDYVVGQLGDMIRFVESTTCRPLDVRRLDEMIHCANEALLLWNGIRELCRARPSPLNAPDLFVCMAPIVVLRGTAQAVRYYRHLKTEVEQRVKDGVGAVPNERFRLVWDNIAIWHHLYRFYSHFSKYGACFVADTYTGSWSQTVSKGDSLASLADAYTAIYLNQSLQQRVELMAGMINDYQAQGFVMHNNRSCKPYSLGQQVVRQAVIARTGVPGLIIEADMNDARSYAEEPIRTRVQAFMETLEAV